MYLMELFGWFIYLFGQGLGIFCISPTRFMEHSFFLPFTGAAQQVIPETIRLVHLFFWPRLTYFLYRLAELLLKD
jgi:hypothetical protein